MPYLTIFTPAYNRARLLRRAHASIARQAFDDFEWIIVDDGSTDETESVVDDLARRSRFPVVYIKQQNRGRHIAINRGVEEARGKLFMILDSDDQLTDDSLLRVHDIWENIEPAIRSRLAGIWGLSVDPGGDLFSTAFAENVLDSTQVLIRARDRFKGETTNVMRTSIRRQFPFPDLGEKYCPPSLVWNRISNMYQTRFVNIPLQIKEYQADGLTMSGRSKVMQSPLGYRMREIELAEHATPGLSRSFRRRAMARYICASLHAGIGLGSQSLNVHMKILWLESIAKGLQMYKKDIAFFSR